MRLALRELTFKYDQGKDVLREQLTMKTSGLTYNARKALMVNIGESAGSEIANLLSQMAAEIEELRRSKVSVTRIVPGSAAETTEFNTEPV